ncbi:aspartyl protease [Halotia wernerae UHCC 0503]|nr:aspartyl protease [Halotia wernerae UHCC 0503]
MGLGSFGDNGELWFEIQLLAANGDVFSVEALFDTGFTAGWLAINTQDLEALEWLSIAAQISMRTARGEGQFNLYEGRVIIDATEFVIPVHVGDDIPDTLMGSAWLDIIQLLVNKPQGIFTLDILEGN